MPLFTHRKRVHMGCTRHHMNFNITIKEIQFKTNQYFLANSHYIIFRKENKKKKFISKEKIINTNELKKININDNLKFRVCLLQDLTHRYLERYIAKEKIFYIRQITEVSGEEIYINCGYFMLPLHKYANEPSGQDINVKFIDPNGKASGTITLYLEHEEKEHIHNYITNINKTIWNLFHTKSVKQPLPINIIEKNKYQLDYLKKRKCDSNYSIKYDAEDYNNNDENTYSETIIEDNLDERAFNESFLISQQNRKSDVIDPCLLNFNEEMDDQMGNVMTSTTGTLTTGNVNSGSSSMKAEGGEGAEECENTWGCNDGDSSPASSITTSAKELERAKQAEAERAEQEQVELRASRRTHIPFSLPDTTTGTTTIGTTIGSTNASTAAAVITTGNITTTTSPTNPIAQHIQTHTVQEEEEVWEQPPPEWFLTTATVEVPAEIPSDSHNPDPLYQPKSKNLIVPKLNLPVHPNTKNPVLFTPTSITATPMMNTNHSNNNSLRKKSARELLTMSSEDDHEHEHHTCLLDNTQNIVAKVHTPSVGYVHTPHPGATPVLSPGVSVKELRRNYESPSAAALAPVPVPVPRVPTRQHSASSIELTPPSTRYIGITQSNLQQPPYTHNNNSNNARPIMARSNSERSNSTLSTHEYIPKAPIGSANPGKSKILVPVRLMSPEQESQYRDNSARWQGSRSEYIPSSSGSGEGIAQHSHRQLHHTDTFPALSPVRETGAPTSHYTRTYPPPPHRGMSPIATTAAVARDSRHYHASPHRTASVPSMPHQHASPQRTASVPSMPHQHASPHRTASVPSIPHQHASPHRTVSVPSMPHRPSGDVSSGAAAHLIPGRPHSRSASQAYSTTTPILQSATPPVHTTAAIVTPSSHPVPVRHSAVHRTISAPVMAPPIRLKSNEIAPPDYHRYHQQTLSPAVPDPHHPAAVAHTQHRRNLSNGGGSSGTGRNYERYRSGDLSPTRDRHVYA